MRYENFTEIDFATDASFSNWVLKPDLENDTFWIDWLMTHPHRGEQIQKARSMVLLAGTDWVSDLPELAIDKMWSGIMARIEGNPKIVAFLPSRIFKLVAACAAIILFAYIGNRYYFEGYKTYDTAYGEIRRFQLDDGTMVTLNANSSLRVPASWPSADSREAWLNGEAFFKVKKQRSAGKSVKFKVHTNDVVVEVKGTEFNVDTRRNKTRVILSEGNVQLRLVNNKQDVLQMKPGDLVDFSKSKNILETKKLKDTDSWYSWKDNRWSFENTPLADVATLITETYGIPVVMEGIATDRYKVTGVIPSDNLEDILSSLESILDIKVDRNNKQILMQSISK